MRHRPITIVVGLLGLAGAGGCVKDPAPELAALEQRLDERFERILAFQRQQAFQAVLQADGTDLTRRLEEAPPEDRAAYEELLAAYTEGRADLEDVHTAVRALLGTGSREVTAPNGLFVRNNDGERLDALAVGTRIARCIRLAPEDLPPTVREHPSLAKLEWGRGMIPGREDPVLFPWKYTESELSQEIAERTAQKTVEAIAASGAVVREVHIVTTERRPIVDLTDGVESATFGEP